MMSGNDNSLLEDKKWWRVDWLDIRRSHHFPFFVVCVLVGVAFFGNSMFMLTLDKLGSWPSPVVAGAYGILIGQVCLISVWCAFGNQQAIVRVPLALGILAGLLCSYLVTFQYVMRLQTNVSVSSEIMFLTVAVALTLVIQTPIWLYRFSTHRAIANSNAEFVASQFGIRHLLAVMAVVALAIVAVQAIYGSDQIRDVFSSLFLWKEFFPFAIPIGAAAVCIAWLSITVVFADTEKSYRKVAGWVLLVLALLGPVVAVLTARGFLSKPSGNPFGEILNAFLFTFALIATVAGTLYLFYRIGYRLRSG